MGTCWYGHNDFMNTWLNMKFVCGNGMGWDFQYLNFFNVSVIINYIKNYTTHIQSTYTLYTIIGIMVKPWFLKI